MSNSRENIINVNSDREVFKLADVASVNAKRINERKSVNMRLAKQYYKKANELKIIGRLNTREQKRAGRVFSCCLQRYVVVVGGHSYNIHTHRCRDRHCAECQRIKAFVWQQKIEQISDKLAESFPLDGAIFGTLTIKNPPISDLKSYLKVMSKAFARMLQRKAFAFARGGFRCFEVTRGGTGSGYCHPHIHFFLQTEAGYFARGSKSFLSSDEWSQHWTECLEAECKKAKISFDINDYVGGKAFVKILRVMTKDGIERKKNKQRVRKEDYLLIRDIKKSGGSVVNYVLKYTQKEGDLFNGDKWSWEYDKQIKNIRMIAPFGVYKEEISKIKRDLYNEEHFKEELIERVGGKLKDDFDLYNAKTYVADFDKNDNEYNAETSSFAEALDRKRHMIAFNIKMHLSSLVLFSKEHEKALNRALDLFDNEKNHINLNNVNNVIRDINEHRKRLLRTHNRLVDVGARLQIDENKYFDTAVAEVYDMNDFVEVDYLNEEDFFNDYEMTEESPF